MSLSRCFALAVCPAIAISSATAQEAFTWVYNAHSPFDGGPPALDLVATQTFDAEQAEEEGARVPRGLIWARCVGGGAAHVRFEAFAGAAQAGDVVAFQMTDGAGTVHTLQAEIFNAGFDPVGGPEIIVQADGPELALLASAPVVRYGLVGLTDFNIPFDLTANQEYVAEFAAACAGTAAAAALPSGEPEPVADTLVPDLGPDITGHVWTRFTQVDVSDPTATIIAMNYAVPETDDIVIVGECVIGDGDPIVQLQVTADVVGARNGDPARLQIRSPDGRSVILDGSVAGVNAEFGITGIDMRVDVRDPAWIIMTGDRIVRFERPETGAGLTISGNGPNTIGPFLADCAEAAQLDAARIASPSAPIDAPTGYLSCENFGRVSSRDTGRAQVVNFINESDGYRGLVWIDPAGLPVDITGLAQGQAAAFTTDPGHVWMATDGPGNCMEMMQVPEGVSDYQVRAQAD